MTEVFVALGANLGDRARQLARARHAVARGVLVNVVASSIYETEPWGPVPQGRYLNQVLRGTTRLAPQALLARLQAIERSFGRDRAREQRYGPRRIDLDLLVYGRLVCRQRWLQIPHPRMLERAFVLVPLSEIAPNLVVRGVPVRTALARLDRSGVVRWRA